MTAQGGGLEDRLALRSLVDAYATTVDSRDADGFASLFLPDGVLAVYEADSTAPAVELRGTGELRSVMDFLADYLNTFHLMANFVCEVDGDTANGETYCIAHHLTEGDDGLEDVAMFIRYRDAYRRTDAGWRFETRNVLRQWTEVRPAAIVPLVG